MRKCESIASCCHFTTDYLTIISRNPISIAQPHAIDFAGYESGSGCGCKMLVVHWQRDG